MRAVISSVRSSLDVVMRSRPIRNRPASCSSASSAATEG
jgi:hypothetical protein